MPKRIFVMIMMIIAAQISCNAPEEGDIILTAAAETVEAGQTQTAAAQGSGDDIATSTATSPPGEETNTPVPTNTSPPPSTSTQDIPCDVATFISDVTVPDGTDFDPDENFTKTWRLKNVGSCTWTSSYDLVFFSGDSMNAPASQQLTGGTVPPGGELNVSVDLQAPSSGGTYKGNFKLRNQNNQVFGLTNGNPFWVEIDVIEAVVFAVIDVEAEVDDDSFTGSCSHKFTFEATITVNAPGTITYKWERSDGATAPDVDLNFPSGGSKVVTSTWQLGADGTHWKRLHILDPNDMLSNKATFDLTCT